jgi:hypothetical protein
MKLTKTPSHKTINGHWCLNWAFTIHKNDGWTSLIIRRGFAFVAVIINLCLAINLTDAVHALH